MFTLTQSDGTTQPIPDIRADDFRAAIDNARATKKTVDVTVVSAAGYVSIVVDADSTLTEDDETTD